MGGSSGSQGRQVASRGYERFAAQHENEKCSVQTCDLQHSAVRGQMRKQLS